MAKKQTGGANKKQRPSNLKDTIAKNFQGDIELYINQRTPLDMQKDAIRSFRDIAMGNFDITYEGQVFLNPHFANNAVIACQTKLNQAFVRSKGEEELLKHPEYGIAPTLIQENLMNDQATLQAYNIIMTAITSAIHSGDLEFLNVATAQINQNRLKYNL